MIRVGVTMLLTLCSLLIAALWLRGDLDDLAREGEAALPESKSRTSAPRWILCKPWRGK